MSDRGATTPAHVAGSARSLNVETGAGAVHASASQPARSAAGRTTVGDLISFSLTRSSLPPACAGRGDGSAVRWREHGHPCRQVPDAGRQGGNRIGVDGCWRASRHERPPLRRDSDRPRDSAHSRALCCARHTCEVDRPSSTRIGVVNGFVRGRLARSQAARTRHAVIVS
jgi:hypothetical protein